MTVNKTIRNRKARSMYYIIHRKPFSTDIYQITSILFSFFLLTGGIMLPNFSKCWTRFFSSCEKRTINSHFSTCKLKSFSQIPISMIMNIFCTYFIKLQVSSQHNVWTLVDWGEICCWRIIISWCHVQLLRTRFDVYLLFFGCVRTLSAQMAVVEKVLDTHSNDPICVCLGHGP